MVTLEETPIIIDCVSIGMCALIYIRQCSQAISSFGKDPVLFFRLRRSKWNFVITNVVWPVKVDVQEPLLCSAVIRLL